MKKKPLLFGTVAAAMALGTASPAFAAHCENLSKTSDAGNNTVVLLDPGTFEPNAFLYANGQGSGGFADVYLDFGTIGELDGSDIMIESDVMIGANHDPNLAELWVNPGALAKATSDNATQTQGMWVDLPLP